jgi:hypothetical protein
MSTEYVFTAKNARVDMDIAPTAVPLNGVLSAPSYFVVAGEMGPIIGIGAGRGLLSSCWRWEVTQFKR